MTNIMECRQASSNNKQNPHKSNLNVLVTSSFLFVIHLFYCCVECYRNVWPEKKFSHWTSRFSLYTYRTLFGRLLKGCQEELAGEKFPFPSIPASFSIIFDVKNLLVDVEATRVSKKRVKEIFRFRWNILKIVWITKTNLKMFGATRLPSPAFFGGVGKNTRENCGNFSITHSKEEQEQPKWDEVIT